MENVIGMERIWIRMGNENNNRYYALGGKSYGRNTKEYTFLELDLG